MFSTGRCQECVCGRSFDDAGAFTRHKKNCLKGRKHLANALSHAKESHRAKKCRINGNTPASSSSHIPSETPDDHTLGSSESLPNLMNATQLTESGVLNEAGPVTRADEVCVHFSRLLI